MKQRHRAAKEHKACSPRRRPHLPLFAIGVAVIIAKLTSYDNCRFCSGFSYEKSFSATSPLQLQLRRYLNLQTRLSYDPARNVQAILQVSPSIANRKCGETFGYSQIQNNTLQLRTGLAAQLREDVCLQLSRPKLRQPPIRLSAPAQSARIALSNPFRGVRYG